MGDAPDTLLTFRELCDIVREEIGVTNPALEHTCDVIVRETLFYWPEKTMAEISKTLESERSGDQALDAIAVITAKVRESIEAKWGCKPTDQAAIDLILRACVIAMASLWFFTPPARLSIRALIAVVRTKKT